MKKLILVVLASLMLASLAFGQAVTGYNVGGRYVASAYGGYRFRSMSTVAATSATMNLTTNGVADPNASCYADTAGLGSKRFTPLFINNQVTILDSNTETVTVTSASSVSGSCSITATFANAHNPGAVVISGTQGLAEAVQDASTLGGLVQIGPDWQGTNAMITGLLTIYSNVIIEDNRAGVQFYALRPSTLTALATPATRSAAAGATQVIDGTAVGTFANAALFVCVTYVDIMGGESPCSASFSYTPAGSLATNWASPAASAGAVGWRAYAGITGTPTQYQLPITSANCVLSTLETLYPACAIGAAAVFTTPTTATSLAPGYVVNTYRPNPQSHTTFAYAPVGAIPPQGFQAHYGPFIASAGGTTGQIEVLGTVPLPIGFLNFIGKTVRVHGHITMTAGTSETPVLKVQLGPTFTTGTPTNICQFNNTTALSAAVYSMNFSCTMTVNAVGASGTVMPDGMAVVALGAGTTAGTSMPELGTAAITDSLTGQDSIYVTYVPTSGTNTAAQLLDLHVEMLN